MALKRTPFTELVGEQINRRRKAQGLRTMEMGIRLGTSQFSVERHLRGDSMLSSEQIAEYADLLGCTTDELIPRKRKDGGWVARDLNPEPAEPYPAAIAEPEQLAAIEQVAA